jgi:hypothetical protein
MYPEYDPNEPTLGQSFANMLRGFQNPQAYQEAGKSLLNAVQLTPNVTESLGRGGVAQAVGTTGDLRDLRNTIQSYLPQSVQNFSNAAEFLTNPYAKALIQTAPTTEQTLDAVPRATAPYEGYKQHETLGEYIAPSLGYFGAKAIKATKNLPIGMTIQDVTPPIEPAKVAEALRQPEKNALGFYSPLDEAVMNLQNQKGTGQQYLAQLLKTQGVKQEEVATRGLDTFLAENPKVTKTQIEEFLNQNPVQLKETVLGVPEKFDADRLKQLETEYAGLKEHAIDDPNFGENKYDEMIRLQNIRDNSTLDSLYARAEADERTAQRMQQLGLKDEAEKYFRQAELLNTRAEKLDLEELGPVLPTKFGKPDFNIPNGENYREVLIQYPNEAKPTVFPKQAELDAVNQQLAQLKEAGNRQEYGQLIGKRTELNNERTAFMKQAEYDAKSQPTFVNRNHFEQPNILTHMRVDDRVIDGKKTLFIQEIQSDWHQKGRKEGYQGTADKDYTNYIKDLETRYQKEAFNIAVNEGMVEDKAKTLATKMTKKMAEDPRKLAEYFGESEKQQAMNMARVDERSLVPDAPFKNTEQWAGLAMKRAMQMAAEGGYDRVAFTTGKQQADRYSLQKQVNLVSAMPAKDGKYNVYLEGKDGDPLFRGRDGFSEYGQKTMTPEEMEATVGKEVTRKLIEGTPNKEGWVDVRDKDLTVGGEGMADFYDKILPNYVNKYGKKHGLKVGKTQAPTKKAETFAEYLSRNYITESRYSASDSGTRQKLKDDYEKKAKKSTEEVHYFDLTPEAKESFLKKGQPMFAAAPAIGITDEDTRREVLEKLFNSKK